MRKGVRKLLRNSQGQGGLEKIWPLMSKQGHTMEGVGRQGIFRGEFQAYQCNHRRQFQFGKMVLNKLILRTSYFGRVIQRNVVPCLVGNDTRRPSQLLCKRYCCLHLKLAADLGIVYMVLDWQTHKTMLKLQCHGGLLQSSGKQIRLMCCRVGSSVEVTRSHCVEFQRKTK